MLSSHSPKSPNQSESTGYGSVLVTTTGPQVLVIVFMYQGFRLGTYR